MSAGGEPWTSRACRRLCWIVRRGTRRRTRWWRVRLGERRGCPWRICTRRLRNRDGIGKGGCSPTGYTSSGGGTRAGVRRRVEGRTRARAVGRARVRRARARRGGGGEQHGRLARTPRGDGRGVKERREESARRAKVYIFFVQVTFAPARLVLASRHTRGSALFSASPPEERGELRHLRDGGVRVHVPRGGRS